MMVALVMDENTDGFLNMFEQAGAAAVRQNLAKGIYDKRKSARAKAWLAEKGKLRSAASKAGATAIAREAQKEAARSADAAERSAEAAERQARAAETANKMARSAIGISIASILITILLALIMRR